MASVTIRDVPDDVVERLKRAAARHGVSMEQELRQLLARTYRDDAELLEEIRRAWADLPAVTADQIDAWIETGR